MVNTTCECAQWARTSSMLFGRDGHHPACRHFKAPTVERFVEELFTNWRGEKAYRLALIREGASEDIGGLSRKSIIDQLNTFMEMHRKEAESSASRVGRNENPPPKSPKPSVIPHGQGRGN